MKTFFYPGSMVVVGVSLTKINLGKIILLNNIRQGYKGMLYGVSTHEGELEGVRIYKDILDLPESPEVAIIITPAKTVPEQLEKCGKKGICHVVIESGGFSEYSEQEQTMEEQILEIAKKYGIQIIGPNCIGIINFEEKVIMPFAFIQNIPEAGQVSLISQSGGIGNTYLHALPENHIFMNKFISIGNKLMLDEVDFINYLVNEDEETRIILCYLEGFNRGKEFFEIARLSEKPIIVHKSNRSPISAKIAQSHTTALSASDAIVDAAFAQSGVIRAEDEEEMIKAVKAMQLPLMKGRNVAVLSRSGGHAVISADACAKYNFNLVSFPQSYIDIICTIYNTRIIAHQNPLDLGEIFDYTIFGRIVEETIKLDNVDGILFNHLYQSEYEATMSRTFLDTVERLIKEYNKPVMIAMISDAQEMLDINMNHPMPIFNTPYSAAHALAISAEYYQKKQIRNNRGDIDHGKMEKVKQNFAMVNDLLCNNKNPLLDESISFCESIGLPIVNGTLITTADEIFAKKFQFPVVAKIVSPDATHKTEVDGVRLNIMDVEQLEDAFIDMQQSLYDYNPNAVFKGIYVHTMAKEGVEFIVGAQKDPVFGPIVMVGLGGIYVELFKDIAIRLAPVTKAEAWDMIQQLKSAQLFDGFRGKEPLDGEALSEVIMTLSYAISTIDEIADIECNPVMVYPKGEGCIAVDARMVLQKQTIVPKTATS
ncbi:MAG TPA: acetate--CoA ligase family protein [Spirochaetota bacterium]|nr:acetate--CoA ligase family protein [Spirochaetota bacterium]